jgi:hypothetical protein
MYPMENLLLRMRIVIAFSLLVCACGGSLSSEQRKKIRANMEAKSIKKISDVELTEAALAYGRSVTKIIEARDKSLSNRKFLDSLEKVSGVQILIMQPTDSFLRGVEKKIIEAYTSGVDLSGIGDNLQNMGTDSLLYTKPILMERPDGSLEFNKALAIRIPKKQVVLSIKE